jgi:hypothetical protein
LQYPSKFTYIQEPCACAKTKKVSMVVGGAMRGPKKIDGKQEHNPQLLASEFEVRTVFVTTTLVQSSS